MVMLYSFVETERWLINTFPFISFKHNTTLRYTKYDSLVVNATILGTFICFSFI